MGRQASINLADVRAAREHLIASNKPHGVIAIRRQIGRGSPQLISKFVTELKDQSRPRGNTTPLSSNDADIGIAWHTVSRGIENIIERAATQHPAAQFQDAPADDKTLLRLGKLEQLVLQQQDHLERIENLNHKLEEQLMQQQDLFDSWRHEQHADRLLLKTQLDQLAQFATKKPKTKPNKRGEQLDLYKDPKQS